MLIILVEFLFNKKECLESNLLISHALAILIKLFIISCNECDKRNSCSYYQLKSDKILSSITLF